MTTVGFIGLGIMGGPMAVNLVDAGYDVVGFNRSSEAVDALVEHGGKGAGSIAEAVDGADVVITMLPDSPDVEQVALGNDGVLAHAAAGALYVDMSTIRPSMATRVADAAREVDVRPLDAPVSGGDRGAIDGELSIMVGGDEGDVADAMALLEVLGSTIVHVGPAGSGQTVKAANQLIVAGTFQLVSEAIVFLEAHGVDTAAGVEVLAGGLAGNTILERKAEGMLARDFAPGFRIDLHHKDMGILLDAARDVGVVIPFGALAAELIAALRAQGHGDLDHSALLKGVEQLSGRTS